MSDVRIEIETPPQKATLDAIGKGLDDYNNMFAPTRDDEIAIVLRDGAGVVRGGVYAQGWAGMLFIKWFWIDEPLRRHGHGRALLARAEQVGRERGCMAAYLDTFEFQARPFYEKNGYVLFGTLDFPAGFKRYFLQKAL